MGVDGVDDVEVSIRGCVATPSRVVLLFDGQPDIAAARDESNYNIGKASDRGRRAVTSPPEYDPGSRVAVLRNPVTNIELGEWLQLLISVSPPSGPLLTHFACVESELPLLHSELNSELVGETAGRTERDERPRPEVIDPGQPPRSIDADATSTWQEAVAASGRRRSPDFTPALLVVVTGLIALVVLGVVAMGSASTGDMGTISAAAFGVIGSVVGAFFGVHAGLGDRKRVDDERRIEATKGQMLAAMMPEEKKEAALEMLKQYSPS